MRHVQLWLVTPYLIGSYLFKTSTTQDKTPTTKKYLHLITNRLIVKVYYTYLNYVFELDLC